MTQNPFDGAGGAGGFDMNALLQQAQEMQANLQEAQERLNDTVVEGTAGPVTVKVTGVGELVGVEFAAGAVTGTEPDDLADLGDLVVAAFRDAKRQTDELANQALGPLAGGGGLPGMPGLG
jgi:DNA-binding protein YbaB